MSFDPQPQALNWAARIAQAFTAYAGIDPTKLEYWDTHLSRSGSGYSLSVIAGSGANTFLASDGGSEQITSGATANSDEMIHNQDFQVSNIKTTKWLVASRTKITTATDAQAALDVTGVFNGGTPTSYVVLRVVNGALNLIVTNGTPTTVVTSWTVDTTLPHDFVITFDGVTVQAFVDGVLVGSTTTLTNAPTGTGYWGGRARNGTTAAARTFIVYAGFLGLQQV